MAKITFIEINGTLHTVDIPDGMSVMQGAVSHNIPGIDADCGGSITCGTCRVCIPSEWREKAGECSELEKQMLEFSGVNDGGARLSCQMIASQALDGLCVHVPESQA
jgi:2Fe-2S ferredoxin